MGIRPDPDPHYWIEPLIFKVSCMFFSGRIKFLSARSVTDPENLRPDLIKLTPDPQPGDATSIATPDLPCMNASATSTIISSSHTVLYRKCCRSGNILAESGRYRPEHFGSIVTDRLEPTHRLCPTQLRRRKLTGSGLRLTGLGF